MQPNGYPDDYKIITPCGNCVGCLRDKATSWRVRLLHEHLYGNHSSCTCLHLTINPENYDKFQSMEGISTAFRSFIDRLRYYMPNRKSPKRFFVSELGEERGRLHFHGFVWDCPASLEQLRRAWSYGFIVARPLKSAKQLSYATKYITKSSVRWHKPRVFVSPGLGLAYVDNAQWNRWHHVGNADTNINLCVRFDSFVYAMPAYYRSKIFSDDEISRFKILLSQSDRPFKKFLAGSEYNDSRTYAEARQRLFETSLRTGKSKVLKPKPHPTTILLSDFQTLNELNRDFTIDSITSPIDSDFCPF